MAKVFEKILCSVGFDLNSGAALEFACELAHPSISTIYLLHVISVPRVGLMLLEPNPVITEGNVSGELEKLAWQNVAPGISYRIVVRAGDPAGLIVAVVEELEVDLILMPTTGIKESCGWLSVALRSAWFVKQSATYSRCTGGGRPS